MNKKVTLIKYCLLLINILLYIFFIFIGRNQYLYNFSYFKCILFMVLTSFFIYSTGLILKNEKSYKANIIIYLILYLLLLSSIAFFIGRGSFKFYTWWYPGQYYPFRTIINQFKYGSFNSILKNIIGNSIMLIPLSFLLMLYNLKYKNIFKQSIIIIPIIIGIELLQTFTQTGVFDIDDLILNLLGVFIFTFIITRFNLIDKIRKVFFTDFKLNIKFKLFILLLSIILIATFNIYIFMNKY